MAKPETLKARQAAGIPQPRAGGHKYPDEFKRKVIEDAKDAILYEGATCQQIADKHAIHERTLRYWLSDLGDEYTQIRRLWIDNLLLDAGEEIERADDDFPLARARELWKRATWYAERRDPARYGAKPQDQAASITVLIDNSCGGTVRIAQNGAETADVPLIDVTPVSTKSTG